MNHRTLLKEVGIGITDELSLRVSVAALVRVLFEHPTDGSTMLALERRATLCEAGTESVVQVSSQPFGGAFRLHDPGALQNLIGNFHFDSEESRLERDFRLFIRPSDWETVQQFCLQHFTEPDAHVLESDPQRELVEEFMDTLKFRLKPDQYLYEPVGTIIEARPATTENLNCRGYPTARIYRIFEARILDASLSKIMLTSSDKYSDRDLYDLALNNTHNGGPGWANTILTLPLTRVNKFYSTVSPALRNAPVSLETHRLDETVAAVLDGVHVPKYQRLKA